MVTNVAEHCAIPIPAPNNASSPHNTLYFFGFIPFRLNDYFSSTFSALGGVQPFICSCSDVKIRARLADYAYDLRAVIPL
ncbi:hypothetical protein PDESU_05238 [Pontiella desulfatans]|uniref:Uncharacterized protein n=1 Tax=Pontiella desulfatans TaxID=2750659 RepID=A0A6C2UAA5_PONDE|nr:hypothetical protein [Pontiella desulfatans]VGO16647.1 hypothetical protein PDESU_05238 [Pontiella desulfatans]